MTPWRRLRSLTRNTSCHSRPFHCRIRRPPPGNSNVASKMKLRGVEIPPKVVERQLDDPQFEVFWQAAEALRMVVCIHPFEAAQLAPSRDILLAISSGTFTTPD